MNSIIERQEEFAEQLAQAQSIITSLAGGQAKHDERIARFERSYVAISDLLRKHDTQLEQVTEGHNQLVDGFERSYAAISDLLRKHDTQLEQVTENLNKLITTVDRYIAARGNGGNGIS